MELFLPEGSCDVAFSNWLLMYLGDAEVAQLARNMLGWVRELVQCGQTAAGRCTVRRLPARLRRWH